MGDDPPSQASDDGSLEASEGTEEGAISGEELDSMLLEASSLASTLAEQSGAAESPGAGPAVQQALAGGGDPSTDLDAQLAEMDKLLEDAQAEVGASDDSAEASTPDDQATQHDEPSDAGDDVPDFMADLTRPDEDEAEAEASSEHGGVAESPAPQPSTLAGTEGLEAGFEAEGDAGIPDLDAPAETTKSQAEKSKAEKPKADKPKGDNPKQAADRKKTPKRESTLLRLAHRGSPAALAICERAVCALERADRPLGRISEPIREIIGWLALATVGMSLLLICLSWF